MARKKPRVSTKASNAHDKIKRIISIMKYHPEGVFPKYLSSNTEINGNTVKSILKKLESEEKVRKNPKIRGLYHLVEKKTHDILFYNLHNVILSFKSERINIEETIIDSNSLNDLIKFRLVIGKTTKKATMGISSDYPFNLSALCLLAKIFQDALMKYCSIEPQLNEIKIVSLEFNKDHREYKFEGINSITLGNWIAEFKLYDKKHGLREEHKIKVPIGFEVIQNLLVKGLNYSELNYRLLALEKGQDNLLDQGKRVLEKFGGIYEFILKRFNIPVKKSKENFGESKL